MQGAIVRVLIVGDIARGVGDRGGDGALAGRQVVVHALDGLARLATAVRQLRGEAVDGGLHLIAGVGDVGVDGVHLGQLIVTELRQTILQTVELVGHALVVESALKITGSRACGVGAGTAPETTERAVATPSTEESEQDDEHPPSVTVAPSGVGAVVSRHGSDVGQAGGIGSEHNSPPLLPGLLLLWFLRDAKEPLGLLDRLVLIDSVSIAKIRRDLLTCRRIVITDGVDHLLGVRIVGDLRVALQHPHREVFEIRHEFLHQFVKESISCETLRSNSLI